MALPRRVPWTNQEEYEEVFSLLFSSNGDLNAQRRAVDRVRDLEWKEPLIDSRTIAAIHLLTLSNRYPFETFYNL